jgi:hypothetical protein
MIKKFAQKLFWKKMYHKISLQRDKFGSYKIEFIRQQYNIIDV